MRERQEPWVAAVRPMPQRQRRRCAHSAVLISASPAFSKDVSWEHQHNPSGALGGHSEPAGDGAGTAGNSAWRLDPCRPAIFPRVRDAYNATQTPQTHNAKHVTADLTDNHAACCSLRSRLRSALSAAGGALVWPGRHTTHHPSSRPLPPACRPSCAPPNASAGICGSYDWKSGREAAWTG